MFVAEGPEDEVVTLTDSDLLNDPITLLAIREWANTFRNQGRFNEAEDIQKWILGIERRMLGAEHPTALRTMSDLAGTVSDQG